MWYLIVSILDLCTLTFTEYKELKEVLKLKNNCARDSTFLTFKQK